MSRRSRSGEKGFCTARSAITINENGLQIHPPFWIATSQFAGTKSVILAGLKGGGTTNAIGVNSVIVCSGTDLNAIPFTIPP
jgi:hypothetical protein